MQMAWGQKVSEQFCQKMLALCVALQWRPEQSSDLMSCIAWETGRKFTSDVKNMAGSGAVGLIQFMPSTAEGLGTTTENLQLLSPDEQLYYVQKYFEPYASRIHTLPDMYMAILMPKYIGAPDDIVMFNDGTIAYRQNAGFDADHNGKITKVEATSRVQKMYNEGMLEGNVRNL